MAPTSRRWRPLVTAPDQLTAEMWRDRLVAEGVPAMLDPRDAVSYLGLAAAPVRVLVREGYEGEARAILSDLMEPWTGQEPPDSSA
ncbi:MAG: DUF2007 domain-containing protein [Chloroflexi bacterium]|nr:DUF2007 domain-containing protein [Chloroflexota bacterium]